MVIAVVVIAGGTPGALWLDFAGYRGRLEGAGRTLWLNLSGIGDDWGGPEEHFG